MSSGKQSQTAEIRAGTDTRIIMIVAALYLIVQIIVNGALEGYGIFRDEFYYLVNAERLAWGYVDHPPLAPLLLAATRGLFGDSILVLRLLPALAGAGTVLLAGLTARRIGGGTTAEIIAALSIIAVPVYGVMFGFYSMNAFEILIWAAAIYVVVTLLIEERPQLWLGIGALAGIGLQNKHTFALFVAGLVFGLLLHRRRTFQSRWIWLGGGLAFLIFLPNLIWQVQNGWPTLEFYVGSGGKNIATSPIDILLDQLLAMNPILVLVWLPGLYWSLRNPQFRSLAWSYLLPLLVLMIVGSSRADRLAPAYVPLIAAGAVAIEQLARRWGKTWFAPAMAGTVFLAALIVAPLGLPLLPPETTARYAEAFGLGAYEEGVITELPQYFADRFGWQELTATVANVYDELPPEDQREAAIFTSNYGEAGAIHYYGRSENLPEPISGHNSYWLWGPGSWSGEVLIAVNIPRENLLPIFETVEEVGRTDCTFCVSYENDAPVLVARGLNQPLDEIWASVKHYE